MLFMVVFCIIPGFSFAEETGASAEKTLEPGSALKENAYMYDSGGRRDPFLPLIDVAKTKSTAQKKTPRVLGTLESYDIPDFRVMAIIKKGKEGYYASLLAPDNKSFVVKEGTVIGLYGGRVEDITSDRIVVVEYIVDYKGEKIPRKVTLELYEGGVE